MKNKILYVDDNYKNAMAFQIIMNEFNVQYAQTKEISLEKLNTPSHNYKLVIVNYEAPEVNGLKYLEMLKSKHPGVPVILAIEQDSIIRDSAVRLGVKGFLLSPIINEKGIREEVFNVLEETN